MPADVGPQLRLPSVTHGRQEQGECIVEMCAQGFSLNFMSLPKLFTSQTLNPINLKPYFLGGSLIPTQIPKMPGFYV